MKNLKYFDSIVTIIGMFMFMFFAMYGLYGLHDERELDREVEHAGRSCEDSRCYRVATVVVPTNKVLENEQKVDVGTSNNCPLAEEETTEHQPIFGDDIRSVGSNDRIYLVPVDDDVDENSNRGNKSGYKRDRGIVEVHKNILLCLMSMFVMLIQVAFNSIIPKKP